MKKLFTVDDFIVALASAVGYGLGFEVPKILGYPEWLCTVICIAVGTVLYTLGSKVIFSEAVQEKTAYRVVAFAALIVIFFAIQHFSTTVMNVSMLEYVIEEWEFVVVPPIILFALGLIVRYFHIKKSAIATATGATALYIKARLKKKILTRRIARTG